MKDIHKLVFFCAIILFTTYVLITGILQTVVTSLYSGELIGMFITGLIIASPLLVLTGGMTILMILLGFN